MVLSPIFKDTTVSFRCRNTSERNFFSIACYFAPSETKRVDVIKGLRAFHDGVLFLSL